MFNLSQRVIDHVAKFGLWLLLISNISPEAGDFKLDKTWQGLQLTSPSFHSEFSMLMVLVVLLISKALDYWVIHVKQLICNKHHNLCNWRHTRLNVFSFTNKEWNVGEIIYCISRGFTFQRFTESWHVVHCARKIHRVSFFFHSISHTYALLVQPVPEEKTTHFKLS